MTGATRSRQPVLAVLVLLLGAGLIAIGQALDQAGRETICDPEVFTSSVDLRRCTLYLFPTARAASWQLGVLAGLFGLGWLALLRLAPERQARVRSGLRSVALRGLAVVSIAFVTGEVALRMLYRDGLSFGSHSGPFVSRFERDFVFNRYDRRSRGPEVEGEKAPGRRRVLIQGDSITWGQGVKPESRLYSHLLLERLRASDPRIEAAALAKGGREIDGHLKQLRRWGAEIDPDLIIYQWYINDIELDHSGRPASHLPWRDFFAHPMLAAVSYFWFFLDYALSNLFPPERSYQDYIREDYAPGTANWQRFAETFASWADEARALSPRVLVALYPAVVPPNRVLYTEMHPRVQALAAQQGLESIDLREPLREFEGEYERLWASPFDGHPSALAHERVAEALEAHLLATWPELVTEDRSAVGPAPVADGAPKLEARETGPDAASRTPTWIGATQG